MAYRNSPLRRLCSATSLVGAAKMASNVDMREQRSWIFPLTAAVSYRGVRQDSAWSEGPKTDSVILIDGGDDAQ
jgi:hypothetical protein